MVLVSFGMLPWGRDVDAELRWAVSVAVAVALLGRGAHVAAITTAGDDGRLGRRGVSLVRGVVALEGCDRVPGAARAARELVEDVRGALLAAAWSDVAVGCKGPLVVRGVGATLAVWTRGHVVEVSREVSCGW